MSELIKMILQLRELGMPPHGVFVYSNSDYCDADVYVAIPDDDKPDVRHQYGCVSCCQYSVKGQLYAWHGERAKRVAAMLECNYSSADEIRAITGLPVARVHGEALAELDDGWLLMTNNCD